MSNLDALFGAAASVSTAPKGGPRCVVSLHDYDGSIVKALLAWAEAHGRAVRVVTIDLPDRVWDAVKVDTAGCTITVHDNTTERPNVAPKAVRS